MKHRRRDPEVRSGVTIVPVPGFQMAARYQAACPHPEPSVEGVLGQPIFTESPGKRLPSEFFVLRAVV